MTEAKMVLEMKFKDVVTYCSSRADMVSEDRLGMVEVFCFEDGSEIKISHLAKKAEVL